MPIFTKLCTFYQLFFVLYRLRSILEQVIIITYRNTIGGHGNKYPQPIYNTEIIGNVIDLCPVGALTSRPYSFTSRP